MGLNRAEAIVLKQDALSDSDWVVTFFTREFGKIRAVARGARRVKSRFGASLQPLSWVRIDFYERENRDLAYLNRCDLEQSFFGLQSDYNFQAVCAYWAEVVDAMFPEREVSSRVFRLLLSMLRSRRAGIEVLKLLAYFNYWILRLGGLLPGLEACCLCGSSLISTGGRFVRSEQRVYCTNCRPHWGMRLTKEGAGLAKAFSASSISRIDEDGQFSDEDFRLFGAFLEPLVAKAVDRPLRSLQLVREIRRDKKG